MATVGIDEVGRGCWAGPLVAGAVLLADDFTLPDPNDWRLADSKLLTRQQRTRADQAIRQCALAFGLGWVDNSELDELGLSQAVAAAMERALQALQISLGLPAYTATVDAVIIDGSVNFLKTWPRTKALVKADSSVPAVSAASIIAKVARDQWMITEAEQLCPGYSFARHVGYGTKLHREALTALGVSDLHRRSFRPVANLL